jgi:hypothetical protein
MVMVGRTHSGAQEIHSAGFSTQRNLRLEPLDGPPRLESGDLKTLDFMPACGHPSTRADHGRLRQKRTFST